MIILLECYLFNVMSCIARSIRGDAANVSVLWMVADTTGESLTELLVSEGLAEVRRAGLKPNELVPALYSTLYCVTEQVLCSPPYCITAATFLIVLLLLLGNSKPNQHS